MENEVAGAPVTQEAAQAQEKTLGIKGKPSILKKFPVGAGRKKTALLVLGSALIVLAGVATGWFLSSGKLGLPSGSSPETGETAIKRSNSEAGIEDESAFPDQAEGLLKEGGIENEGTHHLERPGGPSQNVYLSSTVIDLDSFTGKKVKVWGETLSGTHAGWLMDVGKIKVIE